MKKRVMTLAAAAVLSGTLLALGSAQQRVKGTPTPLQITGQSALQNFAGTSSKGSLEEALDRAITSAMSGGNPEAQPPPDHMITWQLVSVTGRNGGIAGFDEVTVTIGIPTR